MDERTNSSQQSEAGRRALVVDDQVVNHKLARLLLRRLGYQVEVACNGQEAVERVRSHPCAVVLMDVEMPVMDGYTAAREIRRLPGREQLSIIAMTAGGTPEDRQHCLDAGMVDLISKPLTLETLSALLARWVSLDAGMSGGGSQTSPVPATRAVDPVVLRHLQELAPNSTLFSQILQSYLQDTRQRLHSLRPLAQQNDSAAIQKIAHALKGASRSVGAHGISRLTQSLEEMTPARFATEAEGILVRLEEEFHRVRSELEVLLLAPPSAGESPCEF